MMIKVTNLQHTFSIGKRGKERQVPVLNDVSFDVKKGKSWRLSGKADRVNRHCFRFWQVL